MIQYKRIALTAAGGAHAENNLLSGSSSLQRTVKLIGTIANTSDVNLTARINETQTASIPSTAFMGYGYWFPLEQVLGPNDQFYIGLDNQSAASVTADVAIAYEETANK